MKKMLLLVPVLTLAFCLVGCQQGEKITDQGLTVNLDSSWKQTDYQEADWSKGYFFKNDKDDLLIVTFSDPQNDSMTLFEFADLMKSTQNYYAKLDTGQRFGFDYYYISLEYNADTDKPTYGLEYQLIKDGVINAKIQMTSDNWNPKEEMNKVIDNLSYSAK